MRAYQVRKLTARLVSVWRKRGESTRKRYASCWQAKPRARLRPFARHLEERRRRGIEFTPGGRIGRRIRGEL